MPARFPVAETDPVAEGDLATHATQKRSVHGIPASVGAGAGLVGDGSGGWTALDLATQAELDAEAAAAEKTANRGQALGYPRTDAVGKALDLPGITPIGSVRRYRTRNDLRNPRAASLNGWGKTDPTGGTGVSFTAITGDADVGDGAQYTVVHDGSAARTILITPSDTSATYGIPIQKEQIAFHRLYVKQTAAPGGAGDIAVELQARFLTSAPAQIQSRPVQKKPRLDTGVTRLEGFDFAPNTAAWAHARLQISLPAVAGTYTFRVGKAQTIIDPETEASSYGDGTADRWAWTATADQSASEGWVDPPSGGYSHTGFNDYSWGSSAQQPPPLSPAQNVALMQEFGADIVRFSFSVAETDLVWPAHAQPINWRAATGPAAYLDELRAAGLKACVILGVPPSWMHASQHMRDIVPADYADMAALTNALLAEWPDVIVAIEWWNEPNIPPLAGPLFDPAAYTAIIKGLYPLVKAARPSVLQLGGALGRYIGSDANGTDTGAFLVAMYAAAAAVGSSHDRISFHPYGSDPSTAAPTSGHSGNNSGFDELVLAVREAKRTAGDTSLLWITEMGAISAGSVFNELQHAQTMLLQRGILRRAGDVEAVMFHTLTSGPQVLSTNRGYEFLEYQSLRRKSVWDALRRGQIPGGSWRLLPLSNSWVPFTGTASGWDPRPRVRMDPATREVEIRGIIKSGSSATATICAAGAIPAGYRPGENIEIVAFQSSAAVANISASASEPAIVRIQPDGSMLPIVNTSTTALSFQGKYRAEK